MNLANKRIAILVVLGAIIQFLFNAILVAMFGPGQELDGYFLAMTLPQLLLSMFFSFKYSAFT